jgi:hypothetical protein
MWRAAARRRRRQATRGAAAAEPGGRARRGRPCSRPPVRLTTGPAGRAMVQHGSNSGRVLVKQWSNTGHTRVEYWSNNGPDRILVKKWSNSGRILATRRPDLRGLGGRLGSSGVGPGRGRGGPRLRAREGAGRVQRLVKRRSRAAGVECGGPMERPTRGQTAVKRIVVKRRSKHRGQAGVKTNRGQTAVKRGVCGKDRKV